MIPTMLLLGALLLTGAAASSAAPAAGPDLFRLELSGGGAVWSQDTPMQSGGVVVFHRYPDGVLVSIRRSDLLRIARTKAAATLPGGAVDVGPTGNRVASSSPTAGGAGAPRRPAVGGKTPEPGETKDGKALFNPDRDYRPDWDSKQVPGLNLGYPNSPNDYKEGRTLAYPSAPSVQTAPGDVPRARVETGEPPK
jgi:hypothetical protein